MGTQQPAIAVLLIYIVACCLWTPMMPLTDAYALRGVARYGLNYGPMRLWGSAAFVVGALACGLLVDVIAAKHLIWVIAAVAGLWRACKPHAAAARQADNFGGDPRSARVHCCAIAALSPSS